MVAISLVAMIVLLVLPLVVVFVEAFAEGPARWAAAISDADTLHALELTALVVAVVVPFHAAFGIASAWAITRYDFPGKGALLTIVDLPFAVSPVVSGLLFVLLFGARGIFGPMLADHDIRIVYAVPGVILATLFVTLPFVTRELVPLLEAQGREEEEAAASLGAGGWSILTRVTLPRIKWGVLYGCVLCAARAAGEFGAVSVVSGHIRGETNTLPLHVEVLYGEYDFVAAFAVASLLALSGLVTLTLKALLEQRAKNRGALA
ncbi:sulfate ABC transporter permease subunit CysW [Sandaracinus amylolyticus]|uniref:sulfate ABC transporter permease subunit CysW n=1 Tax=Sandaracinus amylolyticus TaxID=927083 RepID=UPI003B835644